jgi:hypothetical protein
METWATHEIIINAQKNAENMQNQHAQNKKHAQQMQNKYAQNMQK